MIASCPGPKAAKQPQTMMLHTLQLGCGFDVGLHLHLHLSHLADALIQSDLQIPLTFFIHT
jgi:hypothetical protein